MLRELDNLPRNRGYDPRYSHRTNAGKSSVRGEGQVLSKESLVETVKMRPSNLTYLVSFFELIQYISVSEV